MSSFPPVCLSVSVPYLVIPGDHNRHTLYICLSVPTQRHTLGSFCIIPPYFMFSFALSFQPNYQSLTFPPFQYHYRRLLCLRQASRSFISLVQPNRTTSIPFPFHRTLPSQSFIIPSVRSGDSAYTTHVGNFLLIFLSLR